MQRATLHWQLVTIVLHCLLATASHASKHLQRVEGALLTGVWADVYSTMDADPGLSSDPAARLLKAHASVATNRNNEALLLFLSVGNGSDLKRWASWTTEAHPQNGVALYLAGDAQARARNAAAADHLFATALHHGSGSALVLSARGVHLTTLADTRSSLVSWVRQ